MKWNLALVAVALLLSLNAGADTFIKSERHTDGYYRGGSMNPPVDETRELWIGDQRMSYTTDGQKLILDSEKKSLIFINRRDNTFVETSLPLDMSKIFAEEDFARLQMFKRVGEVKKIEEQKKIGKWTCTGYDLADWISYEDGKVSEREVRMWVSTDVPFDLEKFDAMFLNLVKLNNLSDAYLDKLMAIEGFQIATEETSYAEGMAIKTTNTVAEMKEMEPTPDAYAVPEGCTKKETLSLQDL